MTAGGGWWQLVAADGGWWRRDDKADSGWEMARELRRMK